MRFDMISFDKEWEGYFFLKTSRFLVKCFLREFFLRIGKNVCFKTKNQDKQNFKKAFINPQKDVCSFALH